MHWGIMRRVKKLYGMTERQGHELIVKLTGVTALSTEDMAEALELLKALGHGEKKGPNVVSEALWQISEGRLYGSRLFLFMCRAFANPVQFAKCVDSFEYFIKSYYFPRKPAKIAHYEKTATRNHLLGFPSLQPFEYLPFVEDSIKAHPLWKGSDKELAFFLDCKGHKSIKRSAIDFFNGRGIDRVKRFSKASVKWFEGLDEAQMRDLDEQINICMTYIHQIIPDFDFRDICYGRKQLAPYLNFLVNESIGGKLYSVAELGSWTPINDRLSCFLDAYVKCLMLKTYPKHVIETVRLKYAMIDYKKTGTLWIGSEMRRSSGRKNPAFKSSPCRPIVDPIKRALSSYDCLSAAALDLAKSLKTLPQTHSQMNGIDAALIPAPNTFICHPMGLGKTKLLLSLGSYTLLFYISLVNPNDRSQEQQKIFDLKTSVEIHCLITALLRSFSAGVVRHGRPFSYLEWAVEIYPIYFARHEPNPFKCFSDLFALRTSELRDAIWKRAFEIFERLKGSFSDKSFLLEDSFIQVQKIIIRASATYQIPVDEGYFIVAFDNASLMINGSVDRKYRYTGSTLEAAVLAGARIGRTERLIFCDESRKIFKSHQAKNMDSKYTGDTIFLPKIDFNFLGSVQVSSVLYNNIGAQRIIPSSDESFKSLCFNIFDEINKCRAGIIDFVNVQLPNLPEDIEKFYGYLMYFFEKKFWDHSSDNSPFAAASYCLFGMPLLDETDLDRASDHLMATECEHAPGSNCIGIEYVGEPYLSEAFWRLLARRSEDNAASVFWPLDAKTLQLTGKVHDHLIAKLFKSLGAMFIMLPQNRLIRAAKRFNDPIPVSKFLSEMLPEDIWLKLESRPDLHRLYSSFIRCTCTIQLKGALSKERVLDAFERRALLCLIRDSAIDHVIPVIMTEPRSEGSSRPEYIKAETSKVEIIPVRVEIREQDKHDLAVTSVMATAKGSEMVQAANDLGYCPRLVIIIYFGEVYFEDPILSLGSCTLLLIDAEYSSVFLGSEKVRISECIKLSERIKKLEI